MAFLRCTGDIKQSYSVIAVVYGYQVRQGEGCKNQVAVLEAFRQATDGLEESARSLGADGVIHIGYLQRDVALTACAGSKPGTEVYAWGTAVKIAQ